MAFLDKFAESSNLFAGLLGSGSSLLECMLMNARLFVAKISKLDARIESQ